MPFGRRVCSDVGHTASVEVLAGSLLVVARAKPAQAAVVGAGLRALAELSWRLRCRDFKFGHSIVSGGPIKGGHLKMGFRSEVRT